MPHPGAIQQQNVINLGPKEFTDRVYAEVWVCVCVFLYTLLCEDRYSQTFAWSSQLHQDQMEGSG